MRAYGKRPHAAEARRLRRAANKDKVNAIHRAWVTGNPDKVREYRGNYRAKHKEELAARALRYMNNRRRTDDVFRITQNCRTALRLALKGTHKYKSVLNLLGCPINSYKMYLESLFETGMDWSNYGNRPGKWSIDHIMPLSLFDMTKLDHQERAFHFSNTRPMWHIDNIRKSNKVQA